MANEKKILFLMLLIFFVNVQEIYAQDFYRDDIQEKREFFKTKKYIYNNPQINITYPSEKIKDATGVTKYSFPLFFDDIDYNFENDIPSNTLFNEFKIKIEKSIELPLLIKLEENQLKQIIKEVIDDSNEIKIDNENLLSDSQFDMYTAYPKKTPKAQNTQYFNLITTHFKCDLISHNLYLRFDLLIIKKIGNDVFVISKNNNFDNIIKNYFVSKTEILMKKIENKISTLIIYKERIENAQKH